jgi:lipid II:glycine glycyltransferase (peptidoglycan interpeptide bridge formation enzyme)
MARLILLHCRDMDLQQITSNLKQEQARLEAQLNRVRQAIAALDGLGKASTGRRKMSAAARARIAAAQRARWAKARGQKIVSIVPKRHISAAGLARIRAANKARWAKVRAQKK